MDSPQIRVIVGLGNPGSDYAMTRHNVGFWLVDDLASRRGAVFRQEAKFHGWIGRVSLGQEDCLLLKPSIFMNRSGQSVAAFLHFYRLPLEQILIAHDDLDLLPGTLRLKQGGGHGGHNGLRDIMACTGSRDFFRLRIGIGHPGDRSRVVDYVLGRPDKEDAARIREAIEVAVDTLPQVVEGQLQQAMNHLHGRR